MAASSQFAGSSLLHQSGAYEPQRKSNYAAVFMGVGSTDSLVLSLKSTNVPSIQIAQGGIKYFNETMRYAGSVTPFEDQTIAFIDYIDRSVFQDLCTWMKQVWNPATGGIGWAADYKKSGSIYLLPPSTENAAAPGAVQSVDYNQRTWQLFGCWPKSLKHDELDMSDDGTSPVLITMMISIDRAIPVFMN
jgi:hypothetical protein